jgi:single-strand DNA-binding protein
MNFVFLCGHLGRDPELKYTKNGTAVCNFTIATERGVKDRDGQYTKEVEWHDCQAWGKEAEFIGKYAKKGRLFTLRGRLQTESWVDKNTGLKQYRRRIISEGTKLENHKSETDTSTATTAPANAQNSFDEFADVPF